MPHVSDHVRADFAQLRFNLSGRGHYIFRDGRQMESPQTCILGATMSPALFEVEGPLQTVGVSLLPLGWHALTGLAASEYVDRSEERRVGKECVTTCRYRCSTSR